MAKNVGIRLEADASAAVKAFDDTGKSMSAVSKVAKQITNDGADLPTLFTKIGQIGGQAFADLVAAGVAEGKSLQDIKREVVALANEQKKAAQQAKAAYIEEAQALAILQQREVERQKNVASGIEQLGTKFRSMSSDLKDAGAEFATLQRQMTLALGDKDLANNAVAAIRTLDDEVQISEQSLGQAAVNLNKFGAYSERNLTIAAIAAKKTGQSVEEVAAAIGKFEKFGDAKSQMQLKKLLGLDDADIEKAGGVVEAIGVKFGTTTAGMASASQLLRGELGDLKQELGIEIVKAAGAVNEALLPVVKQIHDGATAFAKFSPEAMQAAGAVMFATTAIGGIASAIGTYQLAMVTLNEAQLASIGTTARWTAAVTIATTAIVLYIEAQQALAKAEKERAELEGKMADERIASLKAEGAWANQTVDDLKKAGVTREQLLEAERGSRDRMAQLQRNGGDRNEIQRLYDQAEAWHAMAVSMGDTEKAAVQAKDAANKALETSQEAFKRYHTEVELGHFKSRDAQIQALQDIEVKVLESYAKMGAAEKKQADDLVDQLNIALHKLGGEAAGEAAKKAKQAVEERLKAALSALDVEEKTGKVNHAQAIERLRQLTQMQNLSADQRQSLERRIADEQAKIHSEHLAAIKKREEAEKKAAEVAEKRLQATNEIEGKIRQMQGETIAQKLADLKKEVDAYAKAGVEKAAIDKFEQLSREKIEREDAEKKLQAHEKVISAQAQVAKDREADWKDQLAQGKDTTAQIIGSINERYAAEEDVIRKRAALTKDLDEQAALQAQLIHLEHERAKEVSEVAKAQQGVNQALDEMKKKMDALTKQRTFKGGLQSVSEAFGDGSSYGFSLDTSLLGATSSGRSATPSPQVAGAGPPQQPPVLRVASPASPAPDGDNTNGYYLKQIAELMGKAVTGAGTDIGRSLFFSK